MYNKSNENRKVLSKQEVLVKLTALCAQSEHCQQEMLDKMERWGVTEQLQAEVMAYLVAEKYIDETRYARFFINDKVKYNKWGRLKVEQALRLKRIPETIYRPLLNDIAETEEYRDILRNLIAAKRKTVKGNSDYEIKGKLIRFALQRGFTYDEVERLGVRG